MSNKKPVWRKGPPPSIGWWPASFHRNPNALRWWDGKMWSRNASADDSLVWVGIAAANREFKSAQADIEWTDRPKNWPKRSKT